jgi:RNA polymerase sigma-70 factor (family 1)
METAIDQEDIISGFRNSDEWAIKQIYKLYYRPLCYYAERLIQIQEDAEDIVVESFLKLIKKNTDFDKLSDIRSFLFIVTRNACFDFLRQRKRMAARDPEFAISDDSFESVDDNEMIAAKVLQVIYASVEKLPSQCKQVFKLTFIEGMSTAAVASEMGISPQTVLNQKNKALKSLRFSLYSEGLYSIDAFLLGMFFIAKMGQN